MKRILLWSVVGLTLLALALAGAVLVYARAATAPPEPSALAELATNEQVEVTQNGWIAFAPANGAAATGLILYPGGFVDSRAYAPLARRIAAAGYRVVIPSMPLNLAVLGADRADAVMAAYPEVERWAVGGHSLGGAMAAQYASKHPDKVDGLVLWAAYPPSGVDLSGSELAVASIYGTRDGLVSQGDIDASRGQLPSTARYVPIEGGNHAQFGHYGAQKGDLHADISSEEQHRQAAEATVATLADMD